MTNLIDLQTATEQDEDCDPIFKQELMLINPVFRSSILYWACSLKEKKLSWIDLKQIHHDLKAFPECPIKIDGDKNALHLAAMKGHDKKLLVLIQSVNQRYFS